MALYYNLVFGLLVIEMFFFTALSLPYPRKIRRGVLSTVSRPFQSEQVQIALKCIFGFVLVLFIDSVNRVYSVTAELSAAPGAPSSGSAVVGDRTEIQARRFYAQRNMYLCGFTLFLTLILTRTYSFVSELILTKDKLDDYNRNNELQKDTSLASEDSEDIKALKKELAEKDAVLQSLKNQANGLSKEYAGASTGDSSNVEKIGTSSSATGLKIDTAVTSGSTKLG